MKKYELTNETLEWNGCTLHRIRALRDFGDVRTGDLGGWVESEHNLSHEGNCWLYDDAKAYDGAWLAGEAKAYDSAELIDHAHAFGNARLSGDVHVYGTVCFSGDMYATRDVMYIDNWGWPVTISDNHINIWHHAHTIDEWATFSDEEIAEMHVDALGWWKEFGDTLLDIAKKHQKGEI